ncbi:glycosyl hydrolase family 28-related protein [Geodermatophilus sp. SYSU D00758]
MADVRQHGAVGDGSTDDTAAFEAALQSSTHVHVPPGTYVLRRTLVVPPMARLVGGGKYNTQLLHAHDGDFARLTARSSLSDLSIEGQGGQFGGRGLVIPENDGQQSLQSVAVVGFDGYCIDFETPDAGSQFRAAQLDVARVDAGTGTDRYAVHVAPDRQLASVPRSFVQVETQGQCAIDFGGCNDFYVVASTLGDLRFTTESRGVNISASRLLNQEELTIAGHGITIVGCDIAAQITLAPGADHIVIAPNAFNRLPVIDRSGNDRHQLPPRYHS